MTTTADIYRYMDEIAPFCCAMDFDNCGLLIGAKQTEVSKVLLSLDISATVAREAAACGAQLVISHHPLIFHPLKAIEPESAVEILVQNGIGAICAHTNLDVAPGGVCDTLAESLGVKNTEPLGVYTAYNGAPVGAARIGDLDTPVLPRAFAERAKQQMGGVVRAHLGSRPIKRVGLCSGKGNGFIPEALERGADAYICGDMPRDAFVFASDHDMTIIDAGHFETETIILPVLQQKLAARFPDVEFILAAENSALYEVI